METHVLITFSNLSFSSNETTTPIQMELSYESKKIKFNYPQSEPLKLSFSSKFIQDKVSLVLSTTIDGHNKKNKVSFRADITVNKTIFSENNRILYEKNITMIPTEPIKEMKEMKDMKKIGKIFMQIQLVDPIEEWKKNFKNFNKKKTGSKLKNSNISNNDSMSNPKSSNINNNNSTTNNKQMSPKKPSKSNDIASEVTVDPLIDDENENNKAITELNKLIDLDHINQLKEILKNDYKKLFPNDINALKTLNENLYQKYNQLNIKYNEVLQGLNNTNESMRKKAIEYFNEYKDLKTKYEQKLNELNKRKKNLDNEILKNKQENDTTKNNLQKYYNEKDFFLKKLSSPKQEEKKSATQNNEENIATTSQGINNADIKMIRDALKKMSSLGYDLMDGLNISEEEKKILSVLLGENLENNIANENVEEKNTQKAQEEGEEGNDNEVDKEDYDLSNQIVGLIERDVNDLYMRKLIEQVKIDQIDAITYSFKGNTKSKDVEFKIENGNLVCNTGESFTVWLISNFSL